MTRLNFNSKFKTKVVLEVLKERPTVQELARKYKVRVQQIYQWKLAFLSNVETVFDKGVNLSRVQQKRKKNAYQK